MNLSFLCKVDNKTGNQYSIHLSKDNKYYIPSSNIVNKIITSDIDLQIGSLYYILGNIVVIANTNTFVVDSAYLLSSAESSKSNKAMADLDPIDEVIKKIIVDEALYPISLYI